MTNGWEWTGLFLYLCERIDATMGKKEQMTDGSNLPAVVEGDGKVYLPLVGSEESKAVMAANLGGGLVTEFDLARIRVPAGGGLSFNVATLDGDKDLREVDCILLYHQDVRAFWKMGLEESGGGSPPDCKSADAMVGVGDPGGNCRTCPNAQFGSDPKGKRGQACKQRKVLYCLTPGEMLPHALFVPPASLKHMKQYLLRLTSKNLMFCDVITRFTLKKLPNSGGIVYSEINVNMVRPLAMDEALAARRLADELKPRLAAMQVDATEFQD